jgi:protein TonB
MRTLFANLFSAAIHLMAVGGLALWSLDNSLLRYRVAAGGPMVIEFAPSPLQVQSTPDTQPVELEVAPAPSAEETPRPTPDPQAASLAVDRQVPLVEIAEEVASTEAPPAETLPNPAAQANPPQERPPELAAAQPIALPQRTPAPDPPRSQTAALPAPAIVQPGANVVDNLPRKLPLNPAPPYPQDAWLARIQGRVVLKVLVEPAGTVGVVAVHATSGSASLDDAALTTVQTWRFEPARRRGTAVAHEVLVPVRFTIVTN